MYGSPMHLPSTMAQEEGKGGQGHDARENEYTFRLPSMQGQRNRMKVHDDMENGRKVACNDTKTGGKVAGA
jgi:hypothetical protein